MRFVLFVVLWALATAHSVAQGTVNFRNYIYHFGTNRIVDSPFFNELGERLEGPNHVAQLFFWRAGKGFQPAGEPVAFSMDDFSGYFFGGTVLLPGVPGGVHAWVQVRAWQVEGGQTFEEAALAGVWTGVSEVLFLPTTGNPDLVPPSPPVNLSGLQYPGRPIVVRQPQDQTMLAGTTATLSVTASSGVQTSYQWHQQPSSRPDGLIESATNSTYTTSPLNTNTTFWVSIANSAGSVVSDKATVTVVSGAPTLTLEKTTGPPLLTLHGTVGLTYRIEYSTNLNTRDWNSLVELWLQSNPFTFSDSGAADSPVRFYRAVLP